MKKGIKKIIFLLILYISLKLSIPVTANMINEQMDVTFSKESDFYVTIPKMITLNLTKIENYTVSIDGALREHEYISVIPETTFEMIDQANVEDTKPNVIATVTQDKTEWHSDEISVVGNGIVSAPDLSAGTWVGTFLFEIQKNSKAFDITLIYNNGNENSVIKALNADELPIPNRVGYIFEGWYLYDGSVMTDILRPDIFTQDITLAAKWKANRYEIVYDANLGLGIMENSVHTYGKEKTLTINAYTRQGYMFSGWNTSADGTGKFYNDEEKVVNLSSVNDDIITLYAQWEILPSYAVYSEDDNSLRFYKTEDKITTGNVYNGLKVTAAYSGIESTEYVSENKVPWYEYRKLITNVVVEDIITPKSTKLWFSYFENCSFVDLNNLNTSNVTNMAYMFRNIGYYVPSFEIQGLSDWDVSNVTDMCYMFCNAGYEAKEWNIGNLSEWNTSNVLDMNHMFDFAGYSATSFSLGDLSNWNVENVKNVSGMFSYAGCRGTDFSIGDLSKWNTSNITNMSSMFSGAGYYAKKWSIGDLSKWNTSNVTNMSSMFGEAGYNAAEWNIGNLSKWNTSNVTNMSSMFRCSGYKATQWSIGDLSDWNTSNVTNMRNMFCSAGCNSVIFDIGDLSEKTVELSDGSVYIAWDTSHVTNMADMFGDDEKYSSKYTGAGSKSIIFDIGNIGTWNVCNVTDMNNMFRNAGYYAETWYIGALDKWNTSNVKNMSSMFQNSGYSTKKWKIGDLADWNIGNVTDVTSMFEGAGYNSVEWTIGTLINWDTSKVITMEAMFKSAGFNAEKWNIEYVEKWDTSNVTDMSYMFSDCGFRSVEWTIGDLSDWNTFNVTDMSYMFYRAGNSIPVFDISYIQNWNVSNVTNMDSMFYRTGYCAEEWTIGDLSNWNTSNVKDMSSMFSGAGYYAKKYDTSYIENWDTSNVTDMSYMFHSAGYRAEEWNIGNLSEWNTSKVRSMVKMFYDAGSYAHKFDIGDIGKWDLSAIGKYSEIYKNNENASVREKYSISAMFFNAGRRAESFYIGDLSRWNIKNHRYLDNVFYGTGRTATHIDYGNLSGWDVSAVINMSGMFSYTKLESLDLSGWNTSKVMDMSSMFYNCGALKKLDLQKWSTESVENMEFMFAGCKLLEEIVLGKDFSFMGNGELITDTQYLPTPKGGYWYNGITKESYEPNKLPNYTEATYVAYQPSVAFAIYSETDDSLRFYNYKNEIPEIGTYYNGLFITALYENIESDWTMQNELCPWNEYALSIRLVIVEDEIVPNVTKDWFKNFSACTYMDLEKLNTSKVTDMSYMFFGCSALGTLDLRNMDTSKVKKMEYIFQGMNRLEKITIGNLFNFLGDGTIKTNTQYFPTPNSEYISAANGYWYDESGKKYESSAIPNNKETTYFAIPVIIEEIKNIKGFIYTADTEVIEILGNDYLKINNGCMLYDDLYEADVILIHTDGSTITASVSDLYLAELYEGVYYCMLSSDFPLPLFVSVTQEALIDEYVFSKGIYVSEVCLELLECSVLIVGNPNEEEEKNLVDITLSESTSVLEELDGLYKISEDIIVAEQWEKAIVVLTSVDGEITTVPLSLITEVISSEGLVQAWLFYSILTGSTGISTGIWTTLDPATLASQGISTIEIRFPEVITEFEVTPTLPIFATVNSFYMISEDYMTSDMITGAELTVVTFDSTATTYTIEQLGGISTIVDGAYMFGELFLSITKEVSIDDVVYLPGIYSVLSPEALESAGIMSIKVNAPKYLFYVNLAAINVYETVIIDENTYIKVSEDVFTMENLIGKTLNIYGKDGSVLRSATLTSEEIIESEEVLVLLDIFVSTSGVFEDNYVLSAGTWMIAEVALQLNSSGIYSVGILG